MELESDTLELAKGDLGSKRAMTIRDKMIEMDPAIANQVLIEGSMRSVREVSSKDDHYHVLFIRIDATCLQDYNTWPYSQNSESFVDSRSSSSTKCNIGQNTFLPERYTLPTKESCEVLDGCKYYDSHEMTKSLQATYQRHDRLRNAADEHRIFSPNMRVLPSCVQVESNKAFCKIAKSCKSECDCFKCE